MGDFNQSLTSRWEHMKRDFDVPVYAQDWAVGKVVLNRQIRDYYEQFGQDAPYVPGPVCFSSFYDIGTVSTGLGGVSFGSWHPPLLLPDLLPTSYYGYTDPITPIYGGGGYYPQNIETDWDNWSFDW
jgi:hypothetical protein